MTDEALPSFLSIPAAALGRGQPVAVRIVTDISTLAMDMASSILQVIQKKQEAGQEATLIVPVGPVDQYPLLAQLINEKKVSLRDTVFINMDEYLTDNDAWIAHNHPLSFRRFMDSQFYDRLDNTLAPPIANRVYPDPRDPNAIQRLIYRRGGVDACFGGIGINGHMAFNEPPEPRQVTNWQEFLGLPTRCVDLARETRTINSVTVGGELSVVPKRAITVGIREILAARQLSFYCNRPWQSAVVRRVLHGPVTPACPASFLRTHRNASLTITEQVAAVPDIRLR